jgi:hypothetical protein
MAAAGGDSELESPLCPGAPRVPVVFQHPARAEGLLAGLRSRREFAYEESWPGAAGAGTPLSAFWLLGYDQGA